MSQAYVHPKRNPELVKVDMATLSWKQQFSVMVGFVYQYGVGGGWYVCCV